MLRAALIRPSYCILILITGCHMRALAQQRTVESDREALIALENKWLRSEHSATELDSILASDFGIRPSPVICWTRPNRSTFRPHTFRPRICKTTSMV